MTVQNLHAQEKWMTALIVLPSWPLVFIRIASTAGTGWACTALQHVSGDCDTWCLLFQPDYMLSMLGMGHCCLIHIKNAAVSLGGDYQGTYKGIIFHNLVCQVPGICDTPAGYPWISNVTTLSEMVVIVCSSTAFCTPSVTLQTKQLPGWDSMGGWGQGDAEHGGEKKSRWELIWESTAMPTECKEGQKEQKTAGNGQRRPLFEWS